MNLDINIIEKQRNFLKIERISREEINTLVKKGMEIINMKSN